MAFLAVMHIVFVFGVYLSGSFYLLKIWISEEEKNSKQTTIASKFE